MVVVLRQCRRRVAAHQNQKEESSPCAHGLDASESRHIICPMTVKESLKSGVSVAA
jgi:hypothetical protein